MVFYTLCSRWKYDSINVFAELRAKGSCAPCGNAPSHCRSAESVQRHPEIDHHQTSRVGCNLDIYSASSNFNLCPFSFLLMRIRFIIPTVHIYCGFLMFVYWCLWFRFNKSDRLSSIVINQINYAPKLIQGPPRKYTFMLVQYAE